MTMTMPHKPRRFTFYWKCSCGKASFSISGRARTECVRNHTKKCPLGEAGDITRWIEKYVVPDYK